MSRTLTRNQCIASAVGSSVLSSIATLFKVQGLVSVPPVLSAAGGVLIAGILSIAYLFARGQVPKLSSLRAIIFPLLMLILCRPIISNLLFTIGLSMSSGIKAIFLTKMEPYLVLFWVWILDGKKPAPWHLALLFIHVIGALLLSLGDLTTGHEFQWGDLFILVAVVTAALSYRYAPQVTKVLSPIQASTLTETIGGLLILPFALIICPLEFGHAQQIGWGYILVHSLLFYTIALPLLYASMQGIESWLASTLRAVGPIVALPIAWMFFGERLVPIQILGAALVIITSAAISRAERRSKS